MLYLRDADLFFYHGLGLETWVNTTLEAMGDDAPEFVSIHALPDGSIVLGKAMLVADLCEHLTDGPAESSNLSHEANSEIHAEHVIIVGMHSDRDMTKAMAMKTTLVMMNMTNMTCMLDTTTYRLKR